MQAQTKFGIEVKFLTGRYVGTLHNNRMESEWPPHPARLFSALVATWADEDHPDEMERESLEWLERQDPPSIAVSDRAIRKTVKHFVPVNDASIISKKWYWKDIGELHKLRGNHDSSNNKRLKHIERLSNKLKAVKEEAFSGKSASPKNTLKMLKILPDRRLRKERFFPSVTPYDPCVTYIWNLRYLCPDHLHKAIDNLLGRVGRLGHSSSLVACRVVSDPPEPNWNPVLHADDQIHITLRNVRSGQLATLIEKYDWHRGYKPRSLPYTEIAYAEQTVDSPSLESYMPNTGDRMIIFEFTLPSRFFPSTRTVELAKTLRAATLRYAETMPEEISGHKTDGTPTTIPHVSFLPLPFVGSKYSDGRLLGIAIVIPPSLSDTSRQILFRAIGKWEHSVLSKKMHLTLGSSGDVGLSRIRGLATLTTLQPITWSGPSYSWMSATPIALPKHPGSLTAKNYVRRAKAWAEAKAAVKASCLHVGLPEPVKIKTSLNPFVTGAHAIHRFPPFIQKGRDDVMIRRQLMHASIDFSQPVQGPLILGAGRFFGLGLMRPAGTTGEVAGG